MTRLCRLQVWFLCLLGKRRHFLVRQCSWCLRVIGRTPVEPGQGGWITHSVCPSCADAYLKDLKGV